MYSVQKLDEVIRTYKQQFDALQKQGEFADYMFDLYLHNVRTWTTEDDVELLVRYCRGLVKFYDLRENVSRDMTLLGLEEDLMIEAKTLNALHKDDGKQNS